MTHIDELPKTLGALRVDSRFSEQRTAARSIKDEMRENLICLLRARKPIFPGIVGYDDTVIPQIVAAVLSKHNFILLGLRGQAKSRILRQLTALLDPFLPVVAGSEINDNPYSLLSSWGRQTVARKGDDTPIAYLTPANRYVEKLATPDVTIADMIGDIDPIKAARGAHDLSDERTIHFGLLPRANRCIFAINELPDLMGKIQVGLFNIMQEGDIQIKGYPVRLPLDVELVFTANPEDYTARGKIITPLKDRIGSEIRTHYPLSLEHGAEVTRQEAWWERTAGDKQVLVPDYIREVVETVAFFAREDKKIDQRSGVSQRLPISCLENVVSSAERRGLIHDENVIVPRVSDVYAALPSLTGKFELEYEGELRGGERVAREMITAAVARVYEKFQQDADTSAVVQWFEMGGTLRLDENEPGTKVVEQLGQIQGLLDLAHRIALDEGKEPEALASAAEFVLDGLYALRQISRHEELGYTAREKKREPAERVGFPEQPNRDRFN